MYNYDSVSSVSQGIPDFTVNSEKWAMFPMEIFYLYVTHYKNNI